MQRIPNGAGHPLEIFYEPANGAKVNQILNPFHAFDSGEFGNRNKVMALSNAKDFLIHNQGSIECAKLNLEDRAAELLDNVLTSAQQGIEHTKNSEHIDHSSDQSATQGIIAEE